MSNATKWTPGEWLVSGATVYALTSNDGRMVNRFSAQPQSCMQDHEAQPGELIANARLIAAAPELYQELVSTTASLSAAISLLERGGSRAAASDKMFCVMLEDYRRQVDLSRAALKKAKEG